MADVNKALQAFVDDLKKKKAQEEQARQQRNVEDRNAMIGTIGTDLAKALEPVLAKLPESAKITADQVKEALISSIQVNIPEISTANIEAAISEAFSKIQIPEPKVNIPEIKVPEIRIPNIQVPEVRMPDSMRVQMDGVDNMRPLPVMMMDTKGKPMSFSMGSGGGGKADYLTIKGFSQSAYTELMNADGRLRVSVETGGSGLTDSELRASSVPVEQVSGSIWSTYITGASGTLAANIIDSTGVAYSGSNPLPVTAPDTVTMNQVSGASYSVAATIVGSSGTTAVVGDIASDVADTEGNPVKTGGVARQANPTAVAAGDRVSFSADDLGRQITRPVQVRDLTITAYASLTNGTETTLLSASAGSFHDLIYVMAANNSDAAATVDIRPVTAGNVVMSIQVPANGTAGVALPVPFPQSASDTGNNWTADMGDITGTTIYLSALFTREV